MVMPEEPDSHPEQAGENDFTVDDPRDMDISSHDKVKFDLNRSAEERGITPSEEFRRRIEQHDNWRVVNDGGHRPTRLQRFTGWIASLAARDKDGR
jgi:hypothetical protein